MFHPTEDPQQTDVEILDIDPPEPTDLTTSHIMHYPHINHRASADISPRFLPPQSNICEPLGALTAGDCTMHDTDEKPLRSIAQMQQQNYTIYPISPHLAIQRAPLFSNLKFAAIYALMDVPGFCAQDLKTTNVDGHPLGTFFKEYFEENKPFFVVIRFESYHKFVVENGVILPAKDGFVAAGKGVLLRTNEIVPGYLQRMKMESTLLKLRSVEAIFEENRHWNLKRFILEEDPGEEEVREILFGDQETGTIATVFNGRVGCSENVYQMYEPMACELGWRGGRLPLLGEIESLE